MKPSVCCLIFLGGMLITVAASNVTTNSTTGQHNHTDGAKNATTIGASAETHPVTSAVSVSARASERTATPAYKPATSRGMIRTTTSRKTTSPSGAGPTKSTTFGQNTSTTRGKDQDSHSKNHAYVILIIILVIIFLTVPSFYICKKKKGYNVDNQEDAGVPLSAMDQDAFESSSPKEITPELKMFTANESSAEAKGPTSDAVHVTMEDGKGEAGNSVKQGSTSAQAPTDQPAEKPDDIKPTDTDASNQTSVESLKDLPNENSDGDTGTALPKASEEAHGTPAEGFSEVKLDEPV